MILDEYKPAKLGTNQVNLISRTLRSAYDGHKTDRGHADQSITSYFYHAPIVIIGESSTEEKAVKERSVEVLFGKSDRTEEHSKNFLFLKGHSKYLNSLGQALLFQSLKISDSVLLSWIKESESFQSLNFETRNLNGLSVLHIGMKLLESVYEELGLDFSSITGFHKDSIADVLIKNHTESLDFNGISKSAVEQILETFDRMAGKGIIKESYDYNIVRYSNELQLYLPNIYQEFTKYYRDYNLSEEIELLTKGVFTKQLAKSEYFLKNDVRVFKGNDNNPVRKKCFILDLKNVSRKLEVEIFHFDNDGFSDIKQF